MTPERRTAEAMMVCGLRNGGCDDGAIPRDRDEGQEVTG